MRTMLSQVRGLGSAKEGTETHLIRQRISSYAVLPLVIAFILIVISLIGADYETARERVSNPIVAAILIALVYTTAVHIRIGMESVIDDYIQHEGFKAAAWIANTLYAGGFAVVCILSILIIAFGG